MQGQAGLVSLVMPLPAAEASAEPLRNGSLETRPNLSDQSEERFRPLLCKPNSSTGNRIENGLRCFFDLQFGSIRRDLVRELAGASGSLLDIGCGAQVFRDLLPESVAYLGIDTSDAKTKFGYDEPGVHYFDGDVWGVDDRAFDMALCTEVLEHVSEPAEFLSKVHRCLRPGGRLVLTVPFSARWHFIPHDYWRFTPAGLRFLLTDTGFQSVRVHARGNPLTVACYKVMALLLMLLFGSTDRWPNMGKQILGVILLPLLALIAGIANLSLRSAWGDDCLGYTVTAIRPV